MPAFGSGKDKIGRDKMRTLRNVTIIMFMGLVTLIGGCNEDQIKDVDQLVKDANDIITAGGAVLQSPAGALLPPGFQLYGTAAIALASIIVNGWQQIKGNLMKKTTKAIVKGIESAGKTTKTNPTSPVKDAIRHEMITAGIYDRGNQLVDQLKAAR